jgi:hypothetical protein
LLLHEIRLSQYTASALRSNRAHFLRSRPRMSF